MKYFAVREKATFAIIAIAIAAVIGTAENHA
jgi:hypothetical protein